MQKINLIAQGVLELSHRGKSGRQRRRQRHPSGLNYSPRRNVFRRGQKHTFTAELRADRRTVGHFVDDAINENIHRLVRKDMKQAAYHV